MSWNVTIVSRSGDRMERYAGYARLKAVTADIATDAWHAEAPAEADLVVNCVSGGGGNPEDYRRAYVDGMLSIGKWARVGQPGTFIYTSSTGVYPQTAGETVTEADAATPGTASPRQQILLEAEQLARGLAARRRIVLRLAGLYGPGRHYLLDRLAAGETVFPGSGNFYLNLIHRDDVVSALFSVFHAQLREGEHTFNAADGHAATKADIAAFLANRLKRPPPVFDPAKQSDRARRRLGPGKTPPHRLIDASALRRATGWRPAFPSFEHGYAPILEEMRRR